MEAKWFKPYPFPPWYKRLMTNFRQYFKDQYLCDIIFHCDNSQSVGAHQFMLCQVSPIFKELIQNQSISYNEDNIIHVSLPEIELEVMSNFIEALYLGAVPVNLSIFEGFKSLCTTFKVFKPAKKVAIVIEKEAIQDENVDIADDFKLIKSESDVDMFVIEAPEPELELQPSPVVVTDIELQAPSLKSLEKQKVMENFQSQSCSLCHDTALAHRILINSEDDKRRLGIPIVPSNANLKYLYKCCIEGCPFQTIRWLKNAAVFHAHMQKHRITTSENSNILTTTKKCPLCCQSRLLHRNTQVSGKKGHFYKCCKCSASKLSAKSFLKHTQNHISKQFLCSHCTKGFSQKRFLDHHIYLEHGEGQGQRFHCKFDHCNFDCKHPQTLASHIKEKHEGKKRSHKSDDAKSDVTCLNCGKTLKKWYYQMYHKNSCSSNVVFKCEVCGLDGFVNNTTLHNHIKAKHSNDKPYVCEYCPAKYATSMSLSAHRSRVHRVNKAGEHIPAKLFPCGLCGKILTAKQKRDIHIKTVHEGAKDFECQYCSKKFTTAANLKVHEASLHTGNLPHKCYVCKKGFTRKKMLEKHMEKCSNAGAKSVVETTTKSQGIIIVPEVPYVPSIGDIIME